MKNIDRFKKFIIKKEFVFQTSIFRGKFSVVRVKEKTLWHKIHDYEGKLSDKEYHITVNLHKCEWWTVSNTWHQPPKGFRKSKIVANRQLRVIIEKELKSMMSILGDFQMIGDITIKWLHED
jgi:hypothetical protein